VDYFASDWHIGHNNIIKYSKRFDFMSAKEYELYEELDEINQSRRILGLEYDDRMRELKISEDSVKLMEDCIVEDTNAVVKENDVLWLLGDLGYFSRPQQVTDLRNRIRCKTINYLYGNHDKFIRKWTLPYCFNRVDEVVYQEVRQQKIFMSHYAHVVWNKSHRGCWHIFGHSHGSLNKWIEQHMPDAKMLDVGIDSLYEKFGSYSPISFSELAVYMDGKSGHCVDHHEIE
jgi:calcineurin-like phosphoesterase family protein